MRSRSIALGLLAVAAVAAAAQSPVAVGEAPPGQFALESVDGQTVSLEAARGEHAVLLVFFRGTW